MIDTKLLIVDDDVNICDMLKIYFENEGYKVKTANDGVEGLNYFKIYEPDLVLLDIMMPKKDGWQVCREIREISAKPVIMITAKGEVFDKVLGLELGADDFIVKPFDMKELSARIKAVLRRFNLAVEHLAVLGDVNGENVILVLVQMSVRLKSGNYRNIMLGAFASEEESHLYFHYVTFCHFMYLKSIIVGEIVFEKNSSWEIGGDHSSGVYRILDPRVNKYLILGIARLERARFDYLRAK